MGDSQGHVCHCLGRVLSLRRDSTVAVAGNRRRTGGEFVDGVRRLAGGLVESGVGRGDVVAVAALNSDWYMEFLLAITYVGGIGAPLNHRWSFEEALSAMELVRPKMLVVDESCSPWALELQEMGKSLPSLCQYVLMGDTLTSLSSNNNCNFIIMDSMKRTSQLMLTGDPMGAPNGVALICFTSGTSGRPKGVAIRHTALIVQSLAKIAIVGYGEDDVYLHTAPFCHIGGISSCMAMLMAGGSHVFLPKFDAKSCFKAIEQHQVTSFITVPAMMADLISYSRKENKWNGGETVTKVLNGGGSLSKELVQGASHLFPHAKLISAYGMTEACSTLTFMTLFDPTPQKSGKQLPSNFKVEPNIHGHQRGVCVGRPAPHVELQITGSSSNLGYPVIGKILTRGLHVMVGYWDFTGALTFDSLKQGWLDTGDIGWIDHEGDLWLVGREKDRIKSGGENVYPGEVEAVLSQHPGVAHVVVVGIPDDRLTERVVACVTIREDWKWVDKNLNDSPEKKEVSSDVLQNHCRQRNLTRFKIPKTYVLWKKPFPTTSTGKLRRQDVRKEVMYMHVRSNL